MACTLLAALLAGAGPDEDSRTQQDHVTYNQLTARVRQIDQEYARAVRKAMQTARKGDGKADLNSMAQVLSLRDQRDRAMARLTILATRHGWELPESSESLEAPADAMVESSQPVFQGAQQIIQSRFESEAGRISRRINLPVVRPSQAAGVAANRKA
jgi:thiamine pyrophosphate-dependent acetolactate synthase large subunit-like protein